MEDNETFQEEQYSNQFLKSHANLEAIEGREKEEEKDELYQWLLQQSRALYNSIVEQLAGYRWAKGTKQIVRERRVKERDSKGRIRYITKEIPVTVERDDWFPTSTGPDGKPIAGVMSLEHALEIADYVQGLVGTEMSTAYLDPKVNPLYIAAIVSMQAAQMLDNPRLEFSGTETDSAAFAMKLVAKLHFIFTRSSGGFMFRGMSESTQNIYQRRDGMPTMPNKQEKAADKFFKGWSKQT